MGEPAGSLAAYECVIDYGDADGAWTRRHIVVRGGSAGCVLAWCRLRKAPRRFLLERVRGVYDPQTGEPVADGLDKLTMLAIQIGGDRSNPGRPRPPRLPMHAKAMDRCRAGLRLLISLARCDGEVHPAEIDVLRYYAELRCTVYPGGLLPGRDFSLEDIVAWAVMQEPDAADLTRATEVVLGSAHNLMQFVESAHELALADGRIADEEEAIMTGMGVWEGRGRLARWVVEGAETTHIADAYRQAYPQ